MSVDKEILVTELPEDYGISFEDNLNLTGKYTLGDLVDFKKGMQPYEEGKGNPAQTREMMNQKIYHSTQKKDDTYLPLLTASSVKRNIITWNHEYIKYGANLAAKREDKLFTENRILLNRILSRKKFDACFVDSHFINNSDIFNLVVKKESPSKLSLKALSVIIASQLCAYYFLNKNINLNRAAFPKINVNTLETFPIPEIFFRRINEFEHRAEMMLSKNKELQIVKNQFLQLLQGKYEGLTISNKLKDWPTLFFKDFLKELDKQKVKLSLPQQAEWMQYFKAEKAKADAIQQLIHTTDKEIDEMVYELYGLTAEERKVVEGG